MVRTCAGDVMEAMFLVTTVVVVGLIWEGWLRLMTMGCCCCCWLLGIKDTVVVGVAVATRDEDSCCDSCGAAAAAAVRMICGG